jgi:hypothetical protein
LGVLSFIVGLYALRNVLVTMAALALLLGMFWIVNGAVEAWTALSHRGMQGRGWTIFMGLLSIVAAVVGAGVPGHLVGHAGDRAGVVAGDGDRPGLSGSARLATPPPGWPRPPDATAPQPVQGTSRRQISPPAESLGG